MNNQRLQFGAWDNLCEPTLCTLDTGSNSSHPLLLVSNIFSTIFWILWFGVLLGFGYLILKSCLSARRQANGAGGGQGGGGAGRGDAGGWFSGGWGGSGRSGRNDPPPPYYPNFPKDSTSSSNPQQNQGWTPGFWTGLGLGGAAATLWNNRDDADARATRRAREQLLREQQQQPFDWERTRGGGTSSSFFGSSSSSGSSARARCPPSLMPDQSPGAGPSGLGEARRSTAIGSSRVR
ncbi:hypothetical protein DL93DRAFT_132895 [Clavulina sp. PMI_390]|nr:hypothetical protein DL93DRAFT_132895 [Clavulina sp. PMI_390]